METGTNQSESGGSSGSESFLKAKRYAQSLGYIPASFTIAVRTLITDQFKHDATTLPITKYQVARLLKGPSFKSMLYYGTKDLRGEKLADKKQWNVGGMMDLFEPLDLASMIAAFVFYRKCRKLLGPDRWTHIEDTLQLDSQIGAHIGVAIPHIGVGLGILVSTIRPFALATFILQDEKAYREYTRYLKKEKLELDYEYEERVWGCSSLQIAIFLLSSMGFGVDISEAVSAGLDPKRKIASIKDPLPYRTKLAKLWLECFLKKQEQPVEKIPGEYFPLLTDRQRLEGKIEEIEGGAVHWLDKTKNDLSPELSPELFATSTEEAEFEVPEQLADVFSVEDITAMEEEEFDKLVDQMDLELEGKAPAGAATLSGKELDELEEMVE